MQSAESYRKEKLAQVKKRLGYQEVPCDPMYADEWLRCKNDLVYWIETYVKTYDPREPEGHRWVQFKLWPRQLEFVAWLKERYRLSQPCVVKKCRDVGATWLCLCFCVHTFIFERDAKIALGSRKESYVDSAGNPDSLFPKCREILKGIPDWMRPEIVDREMKLISENGSVMTGEAGTQMGTGGRNGVYLIDEFAKVEQSVTVQAAVEDNARFRIYVSTPEGPDNEFGRMVLELPHPLFEFTFKDDPRRNAWALYDPVDSWSVRKVSQSDAAEEYEFVATGTEVASGTGREAPDGAVWPYYEVQKAKRHPVNLAQEVDGDIFASMADAVCPSEWVRASIGMKLEANGPLVAGLDLGSGQRLSTVLAVRRGPCIKGIYRRSGSVKQSLFALVKAVDDMDEKIDTIYVDGSGDTGSDFLKEAAKIELPFRLVPVYGQKGASRRAWSGGKRAEELFHNARAENWMQVRERARKTYERRELGFEYLDDECMSIPEDAQLVNELSMVQMDYSDTGKIKIESKNKIRDRGGRSPDVADAVVLAFAVMPAPPKMPSRFAPRNAHRGNLNDVRYSAAHGERQAKPDESLKEVFSVRH